MGHWHDFVQTIPGIQFTFTSPAQSTLMVPPQQNYNAAFIEELQKRVIIIKTLKNPKIALNTLNCQKPFPFIIHG